MTRSPARPGGSHPASASPSARRSPAGRRSPRDRIPPAAGRGPAAARRPQAVAQPAVLVDHHRGELGRRLGPDEPVQAVPAGPSSMPGTADSPTSRPPPRLAAPWRSSWSRALRTVRTTRSRQRSSRSVSWGKRPSAAPRQKLSKALRAASSSSSTTRRRARPELGAGEVDEAVEVPLPEVLGGGVAAGLEVADPAGDRATLVGSHATPPFPIDGHRPIVQEPILRDPWFACIHE